MATAPASGYKQPLALRAGIADALTEFMATRGVPDELMDAAPLYAEIREFVRSPGKRLRGQLCYWGCRGAGGPASPGLFRAAAALEMFHNAAIFHDDIIDGSDTRRGAPSLHRRLAALVPAREADHVAPGLPFATSGAVLAGDLCLVWASELLHSATDDPARRAAAMQVFHEMAAEMVLGQYQDMAEESRGPTTLERALAVTNYKAARYTFERPLHIGGALAGAPAGLRSAYSRFAVPAGEAFQLRDDLLGMFGDPEVTGKSNLDDLRAGKATPLIALALAAATDAQRAVIARCYGDSSLTEDQAAGLRAAVVATGAPDRVEELVEQRTASAARALEQAGLPPDVTDALRGILDAAVHRTG